MTKRLDAFSPRPKQDGGTWWHKVGSAWETDKGNITVFLDSVPIPSPKPNAEGFNQIVIMLFEPKSDDNTPPGSKTRETLAETKGKGKPVGKKKEINDEQPF